jgi:hypothetical protein
VEIIVDRDENEVFIEDVNSRGPAARIRMARSQ